MFIPESRLQVYDYKRAYKDYKEGRNESNKLGNLDTNDVLQDLLDQFNEELSDEEKTFKEWFEEHKEEYRLEHPKLRKVRYNTKKSISENSREARNNMIIDIEYAILSHPSTAKKIFNPGNFDKIKIESKRLQILNDDNLLKKYMETRGIDRKDISKTILNENLDSLDDFLKQYQKERNSLLLDTFIYNHIQNMTGGKLIGIYANNTVGQAKFQHTNLNIHTKFAFMINGRLIKSLHDKTVTINGITTYISDNCAQFSAASVDNVKDPVLATILQNTDTASIAGTMAVAGMSIQEISLMFSQPLVKEFILNFGGMSKRMNFFEILKNYIQQYSLNIDTLLSDVTTEDLINNILDYKTINFDEITPDNIDDNAKEILRRNVSSAMKFYNIMNIAYDFNSLIQISRADSPNGAMKRNIASATNQLHRVDAFHLRNQIDNTFTLENVEDCVQNNVLNKNDSIATMREKLLKQKMPMLQAFHSLGIEIGLQLEDKFFLQQSPYIQRAVKMLYYNSPYNNLSDEMLLSFYEDISRFFLSNTKMFGDDETKIFEEKRDYYLYKYPMKFLQTILNPKNKEIFDYGIMKQINVRNGKIGMENAGDITPQLREMYMRDFENMLYSDNPTIRQLAIDLFSYSFYSNGFSWGYRSFNKFFSTVFLNSFPEIINALDNIQSNISENTIDNYLAQFYLNHWKERNLLPHINITKDKLLADGSILLGKKRSMNHNAIISNPYQLIVLQERNMFTGEITFQRLYRLSEEQNSETLISYVPVETFKSEKEKLYCMNRDEDEIIDSEADSKLIDENKKLDYNNIEIIGDETSSGSDIETALDNFETESNDDFENALSQFENRTEPNSIVEDNTKQKKIILDDPSMLTVDDDPIFKKIISGKLERESKEQQTDESIDFGEMTKLKNQIEEGKKKTGEIKC